MCLIGILDALNFKKVFVFQLGFEILYSILETLSFKNVHSKYFVGRRQIKNFLKNDITILPIVTIENINRLKCLKLIQNGKFNITYFLVLKFKTFL